MSNDEQPEGLVKNRDTYLPYHLQDFTSLNGYAFVSYMNEIGWSQGGTFSALLSMEGYPFHEERGRTVTRTPAARVGPVLTVLIYDLLPFSLLIKTLLQLPTETWEYIIDWIGASPEDETVTLWACALVCRSWLDRARLHLYKHIYLRGDAIRKFQTTLRKNPCLSSIEKIKVTCSSSNPISVLFTITRFRHLEHLELHFVDLSKEHPVIMRGLLAHTVTRLHLHGLTRCTVSSLLRFINSFNSLNTLVVVPNNLDHGQVLPSPNLTPRRVLTHLELTILQGLNELTVWYIHEGHFLASLKRLKLTWLHNPPPSGNPPYFDCPRSLLTHCASTLQELTINTDFNEGPIVDEILATITLPSLPNLHRIEWDGYYSSTFHIPAKQLSSILVPCKIKEVNFSILDIGGYEQVKDDCGLTDATLTTDKFPSLRCVQVHRRLPFDYFPNLQSRRLLEVCECHMCS